MKHLLSAIFTAALATGVLALSVWVSVAKFGEWIYLHAMRLWFVFGAENENVNGPHLIRCVVKDLNCDIVDVTHAARWYMKKKDATCRGFNRWLWKNNNQREIRIVVGELKAPRGFDSVEIYIELSSGTIIWPVKRSIPFGEFTLGKIVGIVQNGE